MPSYSHTSSENLFDCEADLQKVFNEVVKWFDNSIIYGYRSADLQFFLFQKGRKFVDGLWKIVDKSKVVTYCDGTIKKSNHNYLPSRAVDAIPYPVNWDDENRMRFFAGYVLGTAEQLRKQGKIKHRIRWGGDWDSDTDLNDQTLQDLVHFEIIPL